MARAYAYRRPPEKPRREYKKEPGAKPESRAESPAVEHQDHLGIVISLRLVGASNKTIDALSKDEEYNRFLAHPLPHRLPFYEKLVGRDYERSIAARMTEAGRQLVDALTDLLDAREIWDRFASDEQLMEQVLAQPFRLRAELAEAISQSLPILLNNLGYHSPPPADEWTNRIQKPLFNMLHSDGNAAAFAHNSANARYELLCFKMRLSELVEDAEEGLEQDKHGKGEKSGRFRHRLRGTLSAALTRALPAALAAAVSGLITGAPAGPAGMVATAATSGGVAALKAVIETVVTTWLAEIGPYRDTSAMSPDWVVDADFKTLGECLQLMGSARESDIENCRFLIRRSVYQTLQDATELPSSTHLPLWNWSGELLSLLDQEPFPVDQAYVLASDARERILEPLLRGPGKEGDSTR